MKTGQLWLALSLVSISLALTSSVSAQQILYENGPINGQTDAWTINEGFVMSDSFTISTGNSTINGLSFGAWLFVGDTLQSAEVLLTSEPFGGTRYFDQQVNFTASNCFLNNYGYDVCTETDSFSGPTLDNGTYWLNLLNAVVNNGDPVYWDENSGIGCHSQVVRRKPATAQEHFLRKLSAFWARRAAGRAACPSRAVWRWSAAASLPSSKLCGADTVSDSIRGLHL